MLNQIHYFVHSTVVWLFNTTEMYVVCHIVPVVSICPNSCTFCDMAMASASGTLNTLAVKPSPRSLASQHLQAKIYLTPLVGTATASSSTSQQLSGVAPSWPSCREGKNNHFKQNGLYLCACRPACVSMGVHNPYSNFKSFSSPPPF